MLTTPHSGKFDFNRIARDEVVREGFQPDFPQNVVSEAGAMKPAPVQGGDGSGGDLRSLLWSSIDNVDSRDLDQVEWAEKLPDGKIRVLVGIADVDAVVTGNSATDAHARANATSVYTGGPVFPMLPEHLSTDATSLNPDADRSAVVMEFVVSDGGEVVCADVRRAILRNKAKLNYVQVAKCLKEPSQSGLPADLLQQLTLQQEASQRLKAFRNENGAL
jgi:exoribonuclease-2